jgi:ubiquinone/menaquinone biosynthesis C-methylase UbiE
MDNMDKTKSFWSSGFGARLYRRFAGKRFLKMHQKIAEQVLAQNPKDILDIACGPGDFLFYLSNLAPNLRLAGTDIAPGMVKHASQKLFGKAKILESNGENQPFAENSFDVITIMMAFHHFPKKLETLQNIKKLLRTNGVLIIADVVAKSDFQKKFWNIAEKVISVRGYVGHYTENDIKGLAEQTRFTFSAEHIENMPKRYLTCKFLK